MLALEYPERSMRTISLFDNGWRDAASGSTDKRKRPSISERTIFEKQLMRQMPA